MSYHIEQFKVGTAFRMGVLTAYIRIDGHSMPVHRYTSVATIEQCMEENMH